MDIDRRIAAVIKRDLGRKMVWLAGPRQSGKTTLSRKMEPRAQQRYYNWDIDRDRKGLLAGEFDPAARLWIFDEIHKNRRWRNWLKGIYDEHHEHVAILVTGSARLETYGRGGDSLQGRYFLHRLHPLTFAEAAAAPPLPEEPRWLTEPAQALSQDALLQLMALGGFPEPFTSGSAREASRWRAGYGARLVREDVRDLEAIQDLTRLDLLFDRLPATVGSPLSMNALREDLEVAFATVKKWIDVFERLYVSFTVPPFGPPRIKAVKKEAKLYLWDWARVEEEGPRFENLLAVHLARFVHWLQDVEGAQAELRYFRTPKGQEVDFLVLLKGKPWFAVEAKLEDRPLDASLRYLLERAPIPHAYQVSLRGKKDYLAPSVNGCRIRVLPAAKFLAMFP